MLIEIPDDFPIMEITKAAANNGYVIKWSMDTPVQATLKPMAQPQPAEAATDAGEE